ncbi:unnamed protein product [Spirodela intermedia]|uniref:Uncharacterized protein n=1 Tax=Spirodela intermedia TaxID=51605 RepID=A0A7I8K341_SPIIN|nr:unnamed protein product [Spirodela intermedia]
MTKGPVSIPPSHPYNLPVSPCYHILSLTSRSPI